MSPHASPPHARRSRLSSLPHIARLRALPRSRPSRLRWALLLALLAGAAACGDEAAAPGRDSAQARERAEPRARATEREAAEREALDESRQTGGLRALGYLDYSEEEVEPDEGSGVVFHDAQRAFDGYNLQTSLPISTARLFDMDGRLVNEWHGEGDAEWVRARLLESGDLLVVGLSKPPDAQAEPPPGTRSGYLGFLRRLSWSGETIWNRDLPAHHDVSLTPDGDILTLTEHVHPFGAEAPQLQLIDHYLARVSMQGELLEEVSIYDALRAVPGLLQVEFEPDPTPEQIAFPRDLVHANSARWQPFRELDERGPPFGPRSVLISSRSQSLVAVIDWETHEVLWSFGGGKLRRQHEATWLEDGTLLLLDNGDRRRRWSRVIELDPTNGRLVWQYKSDPLEEFFTPARGVAQALPGRRVLIGDSYRGRAFEVDRRGRVLWRYNSPDVSTPEPGSDQKARRAAMRIERYPRQLVERLVQQHGARESR